MSDYSLGTEYNGVSVIKLDDGYTRYAFDLSELNVVNDMPAPDSYVNLFYARGSWTTASGYIDVVIE